MRGGRTSRARGAGLLQLVLVVAIILVITMLVLKMYQRSTPPLPVAPGGGHPARAVLDNVELQVEGMTSDVEALQVNEALRRLPGVAHVTVDQTTGRAQVAFDPARTNPDQMIAAIERAGFHARR